MQKARKFEAGSPVPKAFARIFECAVWQFEQSEKEFKSDARSFVKRHRPFPPALAVQSGLKFISRDCDKAISAAGAWWRENFKKGFSIRILPVDAEKLAKKVFAELVDEAVACSFEGLAGEFWRRLCLTSESWGKVTHYFPCSFFEGVDEASLEIGSISILGRVNWLKHVERLSGSKLEWASGLWTDEESPADDDTEVDGREFKIDQIIRRGISSARWISCVVVKGFHPEAGKIRAKQGAGLALEVVGLLTPYSRRKDLTLVGSGGVVRRSVALHQREGEGPEFSESVGWLGAPTTETSFTKLKGDSSRFFSAGGSLIDAFLSEPERLEPGSPRVRWLDALLLFGDARRQQDVSRAVMDYGFALDVLSGGGGENGIRQMLEFLFGVERDVPLLDSMSIKELTRKIYTHGRSRLAHGDVSILLSETPVPLQVADELVRAALIQHLSRMKTLGWPGTQKEFIRMMRDASNKQG